MKKHSISNIYNYFLSNFFLKDWSNIYIYNICEMMDYYGTFAGDFEHPDKLKQINE